MSTLLSKHLDPLDKFKSQIRKLEMPGSGLVITAC